MSETRNALVAVGMLGYGNRLPSAESIALLVENPEIARIQILWNQPSPSVVELLNSIEAATPKLEVEYSDANLGSAGGYARLLRGFAAASRTSFVLLLDDDLRLAPDCISALVAASNAHSERLASTLFLAYRPGLPEYRGLVERLVPIRDPTPGCCIGFNFLNLLSSPGRGGSNQLPSGLFSIGSAPWGGLFIPHQALAKLGLPREDFFLYADDSDVTLRFTRNDGIIFLVPGAVAYDSEAAWNAVAGNVSNLARRMLHLPEIKVFHEVRNRSFIGRRFYPGTALVYGLNKILFLAYAYWIGLSNGCFPRAKLIHRAISEGEIMAKRASQD